MMKNPRMSITTSSDFYNFNAIIINREMQKNYL